MSTVYIAMNQPLTTKYLKKGESSVDIDQLVEDVNELKQDVAGIEEVDETQNTDITNLKSDVQTLQTSDLTQNDIINKLRHQIILACGYLDNNEIKILNNLNEKAAVFSTDIGFLNVSNTKNLMPKVYAYIYNNNNKKSINFYKTTNVGTLSSTMYFIYRYYSDSQYDNKYGFVILNALGEQVLNNHLVINSDFETSSKYLEDLINLYGTEYYKEHVNDQFNFDLIETNLTRITNIAYWLSSNYTSSDFNAMTNLNNWVNSKVSAYDPTNSIKTDLTSTWTSSDYETMTNLKNWVESKAGGTTPTTTLKCPVDMYISSNGENGYNVSHQIPLRISTTTYKLPGSSITETGIYIAFHSSTTSPYHIQSFTLIGIKNGETLPAMSYDSLCQFYKLDINNSTASLFYDKYGRINFIMNDGTTCYTDYLKWHFYTTVPGQLTYVHFYSNTINFDQLKNNVCSKLGSEIIASSYTHDGSKTPCAMFYGNEGSMLTAEEIYLDSGH